MKITLTKISRFTKGKDDKPLMTKDGRPYTRLVVGAREYEKTLSGFDNAQTKDWKEDDQVEVEVEQKGEYLNFKVPKPADLNAKSNEEILGKLATINLKMDELIDWKRLQTGEAKPKVKYPVVGDEGVPDEEPAF